MGSASHSNICSLKPLKRQNLGLDDLWGLTELFWGSSVSGWNAVEKSKVPGRPDCTDGLDENSHKSFRTSEPQYTCDKFVDKPLQERLYLPPLFWAHSYLYSNPSLCDFDYFHKCVIYQAPVASVQAADDNCCQELTLLSLQASQVGATLDNRELGSETWGEQAVIIHAIRKGHEASSISKGHTHASICHTQTDRDGGSWGTTVGIKFHIAGWERCLIRSVWIFSC